MGCTWEVRVEWCGAVSWSVLQQDRGAGGLVRLEKPMYVAIAKRRPENSVENVVSGRIR